MTRRFRFTLRTMFVVFTLAAILGGWTSYQLNWIRQRRALAAEGQAILNRTGNFAAGYNSDELPPAGSTFPQRLLVLFGEPPASKVFVFFFVPEDFYVARQGVEISDDAIDFPKVQRARRLFPEAVIVAVDIMWFDTVILEEVKGVLSE